MLRFEVVVQVCSLGKCEMRLDAAVIRLFDTGHIGEHLYAVVALRNFQ
jgi:hypothetical protein